MPETPSFKLREPPPPPTQVTACEVPYAELDVTSNFSFLRGASHPDELVYTAATLGYRAIALTDVCTLAGMVRAHSAAKQCGLKLLVGCRLKFVDDTPDVLVWGMNRVGYGNLCKLLTIGKRRTEKGKCELRVEDLIERHEGLIAAIDLTATERRRCPEAPREATKGVFKRLASLFPPSLRRSVASSLFLCAYRHYGEDDESHLDRMIDLSHSLQIPLLATNHVHYHYPARRALQDVLVCVREKCTIDQAGFKLFPNAERYLKSPHQMHRLFAACPAAVRAGVEIANRCSFSMDELKYEYPDELAPEGKTITEYLRELTWNGAKERLTPSHGTPGEGPEGEACWRGEGSFANEINCTSVKNPHPNPLPEYRERESETRKLIQYELALIEQLGFEAYFLTVYDLVRFARSRGILCQGRGSAANSAVCYCLGITSVDPSKIDLLFERFISAERNEYPDIDVDFEHERREEVIQYLYQKYGRDRAGMAAEVISYRGRSAIRDVGKALGLSLDMVDSMARKLDWWHRGVLSDAMIRETGLDPADPNIRRVIALATELLGFPRHLGQHVGGMVMTRGPLCEVVPIENAAMEDRTVIEWDKDDIESLGILKVDCLGLGMLTCISKAFQLLEKWHEGTKARRHEVVGKDGGKSESNQDISRFDCMAEVDATGKNSLSGNQFNARFRTFRSDEPDETRSCFNTFEHRRRLFATDDGGLRQVFEDRQGFARGTVDTNRNRPVTLFHREQSATGGTSGGDGSCPARTHSKPGTEATQTASHPIAPKPLIPSASFTTSCLRASVPPSRHPKQAQTPDNASSVYSQPGTKDEETPSNLFAKTTLAPPASITTSCLCASVPQSLQLHAVPQDDPKVYDMICNADTIGVFQIESRAQMSMLPRLRPRNFYDLVIEVAIVRPGPIQGNMVHPYLRRRNGEEEVTYPSEGLKKVLQKTLGVPLFQEQAMRVAMVAAGFTAAEADQLRRAMAAWKKSTKLLHFQERIINGMLNNGYTRDFAERTFEQIKGFGEYGFPESHSASFALLVYVSAWLKCHHPAAFAAALINSQPMGFYMPAQIVRDAREHGVEVRGVDVNASEWDCTLEVASCELRVASEQLPLTVLREGGKGEGSSDCRVTSDEYQSPIENRQTASSLVNETNQLATPPSPLPPSQSTGRGCLRLGFRLIKGLRQIDAETIVAARKQHGAFTSIEQFHRLTGLKKAVMRKLAEADAFASLGLLRREALWNVMAESDDTMPLYELPKGEGSNGELRNSPHHPPPCPPPRVLGGGVALPPMPLSQQVMTDYSTIGLSLRKHPVSFARETLKQQKVITAKEMIELPHGRWVRVAGLVLIRQRPGTASGIVFITLEDETGVANLIVRPQVYDQYRPAARHAALLQCDGYVERQGQVVHVMAKRLHDRSELIRGIEFSSRDFH